MASDAADEQDKLSTTANLLERSRTGSSVWNLCSIPSDTHAVDLRDITPSISPVFTDDQVRELSGQAGDLDVLGDNFLPHDTFKRIAEVLSPEQTNLLINTCTSLCSESGVTTSYSDPIVGSLGHYSSQNDLNTPPGNFQEMDSANTKEKECTDDSKHLPKTPALSDTTGDNNTERENDVKAESKDKVDEDSTKNSDSEIKKDSESKKSKPPKTKPENIRSTYSLRSSPRKPTCTKEQDPKAAARNSTQNTKQKGKKEPVTDVQRRKSPRGQKQPEKVEETVSIKNTPIRKGQQKDDAQPAKEEESKKGMSLRRSSRIQKCDTSPTKTPSPRKGRGAKKKAAQEQEEDVKTDDQPETLSENDKKPIDTQSNEDLATVKEETKEKLSEIKEEVDSTSNKTDVCNEEQTIDTKVEVNVAATEPKTDQVPAFNERNITSKDVLPPVNTNPIPSGEGTVDTTFISTGDESAFNETNFISKDVLSPVITNPVPSGEGMVDTTFIPSDDVSASRDLHILSAGKGIAGQDLLPDEGGIVGSDVIDHDVKDILTVEKDLFEIIEKEIYEPQKESFSQKEGNDINQESLKMEQKDDVLKEMEQKDDVPKGEEETSVEEIKKPATAKRKSGNKKDLQPSRRSNRISESIQRKEIEAAVKKAQEEMFREREEQERLEREEEERKKKEEEEKKKIEEEELKEEEENEVKLEKEPDKKEPKEKETSKTRVIKKKEKNHDEPKQEAKKTIKDPHKKEGKTEIKTKDTPIKTPEKLPQSKTRKVSTDKHEEKKPVDSDTNTLFAVGVDHEVYSTIKHKRSLSESEKTKKQSEDKEGESSSSDEERESNGEPLDGDDSDYDPEYDPERLWCICRKPHGNRFMICCDSCEEWLHGDCVSITKEIGKEMEKNGIEYICPRCVIAKRRLKEQGIDPNKEKQAEESSPVKRKRKHRRLKIPGEKHHKHSPESKTKKHRQERHERKSKDENQKDNSDTKRKNIDPGTFYKIPKKVRTTPTPASFSSRTQRKCINSDCQNHAETNSIYCSDACISKHAKESIALLQEERKKRIGNTVKPSTSPSSVNVPMPWEAPHSTASPSPQVKERVAVIERSTGRVIAGVAAPAEQDLVHWLHRHPTFEVIKPTVSKEVKKKDKREEEKAIRDNVKRSLKEILSSRLKEAPELTLSTEDINKYANNIEDDLYKLFGDAGPRYKSKYRSLAFNLKDCRNKVLFHHVLSGEVPSDRLVGMTAEQLASQELARWRERETKHTIEMIKQNQLDINASKGHIKKTHKGEIELDEDTDLSNLEVHTSMKEKSQVAEPDSNTSPGPLLIDTTDQHRIHLFDLNCRICTGKILPPGEPPRQEDMLMLVSTSQPIQALAESSVPSPPPMNVDIQSVSSTESFDVPSMSPPAPVKPVKRDKPVWKGFVMMQSVSKFSTNAYKVSGPCDDLLQLLPDTLHLQGRIGFNQVWDYVHQLRHSTSRDVCVIRYEVSQDDEKTSYVSLYSYFYSRKRCGVVSNCHTGVKDMYLVPLASHSPIPSELLPFDGPGLEEPRPHMLLGIIVRNKPSFKRPRPVHHHRGSSSPTLKRRHGSSRSSEESQPKDSPPREIEDIVFQYNKRSSIEAKPSLSPSSGSSDHSSTLSSPSVGVSSLATENSGDNKGSTQKTQQEELQDLADRAKQYIASALQAKKQTDQPAVETSDEKKSDDNDKPYDPEEDFDLDVELEKPIDEKNKAGSSTKTPMKHSAVSSSEVVGSSRSDVDESKLNKSNTSSVVPNTGASVLSAGSNAGSLASKPSSFPSSGVSSASSVPRTLAASKPSSIPSSSSSTSSIPLLDTVSSSTPTTSAIPSIPTSLFMPITTSSVTTSSLSTQSTLPIPSSEIAGIVKLLGASLKQANTAGQPAVQGQPDTHKATTVSTTPNTSTSTATRHDSRRESADSYHTSRSSTSEKDPHKASSEGSRRHGDHTSETERQRIDRERLEWRERRASRDGPRGHGDSAPHEDRWRDNRAPPVRRPSDDRHYGDSYGPHRGSHGDRGRYHPYHHRGNYRDDRRGERPRDDPRWREKWRR